MARIHWPIWKGQGDKKPPVPVNPIAGMHGWTPNKPPPVEYTWDEESEIPTGITPIRAVRAWDFAEHEYYGPRLSSLFISQVYWPLRGELTGECLAHAVMGPALRSGIKPHKTPSLKCPARCGIWALRTPQVLEAAVHPTAKRIFGVVDLWGRYVKGSLGYRAQYARPVALVVVDGRNEEITHQAGMLYEIEVMTKWKKTLRA